MRINQPYSVSRRNAVRGGDAGDPGYQTCRGGCRTNILEANALTLEIGGANGWNGPLLTRPTGAKRTLGSPSGRGAGVSVLSTKLAKRCVPLDRAAALLMRWIDNSFKAAGTFAVAPDHERSDRRIYPHRALTGARERERQSAGNALS